jgi:hypothetical protein
MKLAGVLIALALSALACTSGSTRGSGSGPLTFSGEEPEAGATVFLRERPVLVPNRVGVDVVARGAGDLHGAAFRLTWDPSALAFVSAQSGETWSKSVLALAKEGTPGQLAVAWTEKGEIGIDASHEVVLGTLLFESRGRTGTPIAFKAERSTVVDKKGVPVTVSWRGGTVAY